MAGTFNPQILVEKLAKLNSSQQSIETLSHWCIFHMSKAKQVVDAWERQFYCCPREQRLSFLYLANDILQNSRRKGSEFLGEFWRVLPNALRDVIDNGDDWGRKAALRLIGIWEDRKVFGSRGRILKEEFVVRHLDNNNRNGKQSSVKPANSSGSSIGNIISSYNIVHQLEEDAISKKCRNAIGCIQKVDKEIGGNIRSGQPNGTAVIEELKGQQAILRECIEQLTVVESSRASLVSDLREVLQEQELRLDEVHNQLEAASFQSEQAGNICMQLLNGNNVQLLTELSTVVSESDEQTTPVIYTRQVPFAEKPSRSEEEPKSAAAAVAAKLTSSSSSAQMLSYVLSSLASEGVIGNSANEPSLDVQSEKRQKLENDQSSYDLTHNPQAPVAPFSHHESMQPTPPVTSRELTPSEHPPPPSSPPPLPPLPPMQPYPVPQYMQTAGSMPGVRYGVYSSTQLHPPMLPSYTTMGPPLNAVPPFIPPPPNGYQGFPRDSGFYSQPSSLPMAPLPRQ